MTLDGGVSHPCLPIALNNSEILGKNPDYTFELDGSAIDSLEREKDVCTTFVQWYKRSTSIGRVNSTAI